jgi:hypothetical protein
MFYLSKEVLLMMGPMLHVTIELIMLPTKGLVLMLMKGLMLL